MYFFFFFYCSLLCYLLISNITCIYEFLCRSHECTALEWFSDSVSMINFSTAWNWFLHFYLGIMAYCLFITFCARLCCLAVVVTLCLEGSRELWWCFRLLLCLSNFTNLSHGDDIKSEGGERGGGGGGGWDGDGDGEVCSDCPGAEKLEKLPVVNIYLAVNDRPAQNKRRE